VREARPFGPRTTLGEKAGPAVRLDPDRVHAWRLRPQWLRPTAAAGKLGQVATELVGVQAQVLSSAALSLALRVRNGRAAALNKALAEHRLIRSWAMRGTLHVFAAGDYPTIAAALRRREGWRSPVWLRYFNVTEPQMEAIIETTGEVLADGVPRSRAELAEALGRRLGGDVREQISSSWGTFLKPASYRGHLCQVPGEGPAVRFTSPRNLVEWRDVDPDEALADVVRRYLHAYGPASIGDIARWWGGQRKDVRGTLDELRAETTEVEVDGERALALSADVQEIARIRPDGDAPLLLGGFDPLIVGAGLRAQLVPKPHLARVSRTSGWISPVLLVGGRVAGVWNSVRDGGRLRLTVEVFDGQALPSQTGLQAEADRVGRIHGLEAVLELGPILTSSTTTQGAGALDEASRNEASGDGDA
jgi:hypothetical protein